MRAGECKVSEGNTEALQAVTELEKPCEVVAAGKRFAETSAEEVPARGTSFTERLNESQKNRSLCTVL